LRWVAAGKSDWAIGQILRISEKTVNFHVENAKRKLGVGTRIQAVVAAMRAGLIDDDPVGTRDFDRPIG
jgi:DNA-binding CsgD family transcriptional regulator